MTATLEQRIDDLEKIVSDLRAKVLGLTPVKKDWRSTVGKFANDDTFDEAVKLGREYRESQKES